MPDQKTGSARLATKTATNFVNRVGFLAIGLVVGLIIGVALMLFVQNYNPPDKKTAPEVLAASVVFERIQAQNELVSASQRYNITEKAGSSNTIPFTDIPIPFTDNSFWYRYVGTIKVGVNLEEAQFEQNGNTIKVTLKEPIVISNTPDRDKSGVLEERNNIFNPIHIEDIDAFLAQCQEMGEAEAINNGIMDEAKENAEKNIRDMFYAAYGDEYTIEFNWV